MIYADSSGKIHTSADGQILDFGGCETVNVTVTLDADVTIEVLNNAGCYANGAGPTTNPHTFAGPYSGSIDRTRCPSPYVRLSETDLGNGWTAWLELAYDPANCRWAIGFVVGNYDINGETQGDSEYNVAVYSICVEAGTIDDPYMAFGPATIEGGCKGAGCTPLADVGATVT
jgi:hypothetical protein